MSLRHTNRFDTRSSVVDFSEIGSVQFVVRMSLRHTNRFDTRSNVVDFGEIDLLSCYQALRLGALRANENRAAAAQEKMLTVTAGDDAQHAGSVLRIEWR